MPRTALRKTAALLVVLAIMTVPAAGCFSKKAEKGARPNIILVLTDDQDASTLRYMQLTNAYASLDQTRKAALHEKTRALAGCAGDKCRSLEERTP